MYTMVSTVQEISEAIGESPDDMALDKKVFDGDFNAKIRARLNAVGKDAIDVSINWFASRITQRINELRDC